MDPEDDIIFDSDEAVNLGKMAVFICIFINQLMQLQKVDFEMNE